MDLRIAMDLKIAIDLKIATYLKIAIDLKIAMDFNVFEKSFWAENSSRIKIYLKVWKMSLSPPVLGSEIQTDFLAS